MLGTLECRNNNMVRASSTMGQRPSMYSTQVVGRIKHKENLKDDHQLGRSPGKQAFIGRGETEEHEPAPRGPCNFVSSGTFRKSMWGVLNPISSSSLS